MKKLFFLPFAAAAMMLSACSDEEPAGGGNENESTNKRYLAISIVSTDGNSSRATGDPSSNPPYDNGVSKYEDGLSNENKVESLRIYFFGPKGSAINVKGHEDGGNYYDVELSKNPTSNNPEHDITVENKINAVLVVNTGETLPSKLVAVVNPTKKLEGKYDLTNLRRIVNTYADYANNNDHFVMANSAYVESGAAVEATIIMPENYAKTADEALDKPVTIYVERNVAKVRIRANMTGKEPLTDGGIMLPIYDKTTKKPYVFNKTNSDNKIEEVAVYAKFYGWDIAGDLKYAFLTKNVRAGWRENIIGPGNWNDPNNHRSYWADVCGGGTEFQNNVNQYFSYADKSYYKQTKFDDSEWKYCNENGEKNYNGTYFKNTEVIIKAELCDQNGNPLTFTEIAGIRTIDDNNFTNLKNSYLEMVKGRAHTHWKVTKDADGKITSIKELEPSDITFITANSAHKTYKSVDEVLENGTYYVYPCLTNEVASNNNIEWYTNLNVGGTDENPEYTPVPESKVTVDQINAHLYEIGHSKIWNSGKTYYYTTIMQGSQAGVVRNHIYDITLNNVYGIGTPVYDPDEKIIPEKPTDDDTYIAAEVKILSWRLNSTNVDLEWD